MLYTHTVLNFSTDSLDTLSVGYVNIYCTYNMAGLGMLLTVSKNLTKTFLYQ